MAPEVLLSACVICKPCQKHVSPYKRENVPPGVGAGGGRAGRGVDGAGGAAVRVRDGARRRVELRRAGLAPVHRRSARAQRAVRLAVRPPSPAGAPLSARLPRCSLKRCTTWQCMASGDREVLRRTGSIAPFMTPCSRGAPAPRRAWRRRPSNACARGRRVADDCPLAVAELLQACLDPAPAARPTSAELVRVIAEALQARTRLVRRRAST
jgi:hypothetical protein